MTDNAIWVIAEIGVNHDGDVGIALELIDAAAEAGADAVKFQIFNPALVATTSAQLAPYQRDRQAATSQKAMLERLTLTRLELERTRLRADNRGLAWFATAFDLESLAIAEALEPCVHKAPSGELTNLPFITKVATLGRPVLLSTGMSSWAEVEAARAAAAAAPQVVLLHCVSAYPAPIEDANLLAISELSRRFGDRVGWSDHCVGSETALAAVALGAAVIERHLTLDHSREGPDHAASSTPSELAAYIRGIRTTYISLGDGDKRVRPSELENRTIARRGWYATRALEEGGVVGPGDAIALRPEAGLTPSTAIVGATLLRTVNAGAPLHAGDVRLPVAPVCHDRPRRVCVFTGSRAEYGLLAPILRRIQQSDRLELQLIVAGSHLSRLHGHTIDQVRGDGFRIDATIEMVFASDTPVAATKSVGVALLDLAVQLDRLRPDVLVVLGDRFELLALCSAGLLLGIPIAHVHGGELTEGAFDDAVRHAVTKLSHLHFPAADEFARRIIQMGESPNRVHVVGAPGLDTLRSIRLLGRSDLEAVLGYSLLSPIALVTYHPATIPGEDPATVSANILEAVRSLPFGTIITGTPNADPRFGQVWTALEAAAALDARIRPTPSVGHEAFLSLMALADVIVGNSSSAIIEAPALRVPAVLVGRRQDGRPRASSVVDCDTSVDAIRTALETVLTSEFLDSMADIPSPYDRGVSAADAIVRVLEQADPRSLLNKRFYSFTQR